MFSLCFTCYCCLLFFFPSVFPIPSKPHPPPFVVYILLHVQSDSSPPKLGGGVHAPAHAPHCVLRGWEWAEALEAVLRVDKRS